MFSAELELDDFHRNRDLTIERLGFGIRDATQNAAEAGAAEAKAIGPFKDRTGNLRGNIIAEFLRSAERSSEWAIYSPTPYSVFVENPTKAHEIWPKASYGAAVGSLKPGQTRRGRGKGPHEHIVGRGQFLRWKDAGGEHFAQMVHHPGTPGFPYMAPAAIKAETVLRSGLEIMIVNMQKIWN